MTYNADKTGEQPVKSAYTQNQKNFAPSGQGTKTHVDKWWKSNIYVDLQTGERITINNAKTNYIIIKKRKHVNYIKQLNKQRQYETIGHIEYTNECTREGKQLQLW